jgi:hypothetical protein
MNSREQAMYGMSTDAIRTQYMESFTATQCGLEMVVMGIMSDCQEMLALEHPISGRAAAMEYVRKQMNVAKFILCEMMDQKESV